METGWVEKPHTCEPPTTLHVSLATIGAIWRCECGREWEIVRNRLVGEHNAEVLYILHFIDESAIGPTGRGVDRAWR
jgi:hypothetical protein